MSRRGHLKLDRTHQECKASEMFRGHLDVVHEEIAGEFVNVPMLRNRFFELN
jgi:hypothetical protein